MKKFSIMAVALAVALLGAGPAAAAKPDKPPKPPKPPASALVAVSLDASPMWVHEDADVLEYTVTLHNKTSADIDNIRVELSPGSEPDDSSGFVLSANETQTLEFSRAVSQFPGRCVEPGEECDLVAKAAVLLGTEVMTQATMSTPLMPYPSCGLEDEVADVTGGTCIWNPPNAGTWTVSLEPTPPSNPKRHSDVLVTVRDHVPGNWCGAWSGKWRPDDGPVEVSVHLPANGVCLAGGAGGEFFDIGNPESVYLYFRPAGIISVAPTVTVPPADE